MKLYKKISIYLIACVIINNSQAQNVLPTGFKQYKVKIPANASDWVSTGIIVLKEDFVIYEASGEVKLGDFMMGLDKVKPTGIDNEIAALRYNRAFSVRHGELLCLNDNEVVNTIGEKVLIDPRKIIAWSTMEEDFIGNFFVSKKIKNSNLSLMTKHTTITQVTSRL